MFQMRSTDQEMVTARFGCWLHEYLQSYVLTDEQKRFSAAH